MCVTVRDNAFPLQRMWAKCTEELNFWWFMSTLSRVVFCPWNHLEVLSPQKLLNILLSKAPFFFNTFLEAKTVHGFKMH